VLAGAPSAPPWLTRVCCLPALPAWSASTHNPQDLSAKPFFKDLVGYIISGPVVCMIWEGPGVVKSARKLIGATNPLEAEPGTIRGDLAVEVGRNVVHGSDSVENGEREIALWFGKDAAIEWTPAQLPWLREL
jgi:nucleoside-diphosphate kinase